MLEVRGLTKNFPVPKQKKGQPIRERDPREDGNTFHAVRDVAFESKPGEILGLLGMNGAGKTTTLRMLATAIKPSSGTALLDGVDITKDPPEVRRRIGFLSGSTGLYGRLTAKEMVAYYGRLNGIDDATLKNRMAELFNLLDMESFLDKRNDNLSTGMKQKVSIARTLVHDPAVLFFDEPTSGLDVLSSRTIVDFIKSCREGGKTVIFSTHIMNEVDKLCDRVVVIHLGKVFFTGTVEELRAQTGQQDLEDAFTTLVAGGASND
jgi:sodium transport system ATP-binding protein